MAQLLFIPAGAQTMRRTTVKQTSVDTDQALFSITGGRVRVYELFARVTEALGAGATQIALEADAIVDSPLCTPSANVALAPIDTLLVMSGLVTDALIVSAGTGASRGQGLALIVNPCTITALITGGTTGTLEWSCTWESISAGATLAAI